MHPAFRILAVTGVLMLAPLLTPLANPNGNVTNNGCTCHGSVGGVTISIEGPPTWDPDVTYPIWVNATGSLSGNEGGFNLATNEGFFVATSPDAQIDSSTGKATHKTSASRSWRIEWRAPSSSSAATDATFTAFALLANGDGMQSSADDWGGPFTATIDRSPEPPLAISPSVEPSDATGDDDLTLTYTYQSPTGTAESGTIIRWYRDGTHLPAYDQLKTVGSGEVRRDQVWNVTLIVSDGTLSGDAIDVDGPYVQNAPPIASGSISPAVPQESDDLLLSPQFTDGDDEPILDSEVRWTVDGSESQIHANANTISSAHTRNGQTWIAEGREQDTEGWGQWFEIGRAVIGIANLAPTVTNVQITPVNPKTTSELSVNWDFSDPEGVVQQNAVLHWYRNGSHIVAHDGLNPLPPSAIAKGQVWFVEVRGNDGVRLSAPVNSSEVVIQNSNPRIISASIGPGNPTTQDNLTVSFLSDDPDGDNISTSIAWVLDGTTASELANVSIVPHDLTEKGQMWKAVLTPSDGFSQGAQFTVGPIQIGNILPTAKIIVPNSTTSLENITPDVLVEDLDGDVVNLQWVWRKNGIRVSALDNMSQINLERLSPGQLWTAEVTPSDDNSIGQTTYATIEIIDIPPVINVHVEKGVVWAGIISTLNASGSIDHDGNVHTATWLIEGETLTGLIVEYRFLAPGNISYSIEVRDMRGTSTWENKSLIVQELPVPINLVASMQSADVINLQWNVATSIPGEIKWAIFRSTSPITDENLVDLSPLKFSSNKSATINESIAGEVYYLVLPSIDGKHPLNVDAGISTKYTIIVEENLESATPSGSIPSKTSYLVFFWIATAIIALSAALIRSGRRE